MVETGIYSEITDIIVNNFKQACLDSAGMDIFMFNFIVEECEMGVESNWTGPLAHETMKDIEVGNFVDCTIGIKLTKANPENFVFNNLVFANVSVPTPTHIAYDGTNYIYGGVANILNCTYDNVGTFMNGFDFARTDGRDADIVVMGNIGEEDKLPHAKFNIIDNAVTTTITVAGTYYKIAGLNAKTWLIFNIAASAGTFTITIGAETTGNINWNASAADIKTAIEALTNVTTVTVTQVVAAKEWTIEFLTAGEGWVAHQVSATITGLTGPTTYEARQRFYTCKMGITNNRMTFLSTHKRDGMIWVTGNISVNNNSRNLTLGIRKNAANEIYSPFTVRTGNASANIPQGFAFSTYLEDLVHDDYFGLWATSANAGDIITVQDLNIMFTTL